MNEKNNQIMSTLSSQLGWSHYVELIELRDNKERNYLSGDYLSESKYI